MPGTNAGTGQPYAFKCANCSRHWWRGSIGTTQHGREYKATGKIRPLASGQRGGGGSRMVPFRIQYQCLECGHIGWSRHKDVARQLQRQFQLTDAAIEGFRQFSREITVSTVEKFKENAAMEARELEKSRHG